MNVNIPDVQPDGDQRPQPDNVIDESVQQQIINDQQESLGQANEQPSNGHPAWKEILDVLPESLHSAVKPTLQKWDQGVQEKLSSVRSEYEPYKEFVDNEIDADTIKQSLWLLDRLQTDPEVVAREIIEAWELQDKFNAAPAVQEAPEMNQQNTVEDDDFSEFDLTKHPEFIAMKQALESLQSETEAQKKAREEQEALQAIETQLKNLRESHGEFDETYVLALMSQGIDGEKAVKQFHDTVNQAAAQLAGSNQQQQTPQIDPPVVLGNEGAGSGIPQNPINPGQMKASDREQLVAELLKNRSQ